MSQIDWLRGVKRTSQQFDDLVLRILRTNPEIGFTAKGLADRLTQFNGQMRPDVNRVLRSMKRLAAANKVTIRHFSRGWFNYYIVRYKNDQRQS